MCIRILLFIFSVMNVAAADSEIYKQIGAISRGKEALRYYRAIVLKSLTIKAVLPKI